MHPLHHCDTRWILDRFFTMDSMRSVTCHPTDQLVTLLAWWFHRHFPLPLYILPSNFYYYCSFPFLGSVPEQKCWPHIFYSKQLHLSRRVLPKSIHDSCWNECQVFSHKIVKLWHPLSITWCLSHPLSFQVIYMRISTGLEATLMMQMGLYLMIAGIMNLKKTPPHRTELTLSLSLVDSCGYPHSHRVICSLPQF